MLTIEKIGSVEGLISLRDEWEGLLARCPHRMPFLTHSWMMTWWKSFGPGKELYILVMREHGRVVAIAPLMSYWGWFYDRYLKFPAKVIEGMANYHSNRLDLIYAEYREEYIERLWEYLLHEGGWHFLRLYPVPADSPTLGGFRQLAAKGVRAVFMKDQASPYLTLRNGWDEYARGLPRRIRRKVRLSEQLMADNRLEAEFLTREANTDDVVQDMFSVASKSWAGDEGTAISSTDQLRQFYTELARVAQQEGWMFFGLLKMSGKPVAFEYNLRYNQTVYNMVIAFDPAFSQYGPGHVIKYFALSEAFGNGNDINTYDFLGDAAPYKLMWTAKTRQHLKVYLYHPHSSYGRLLHLIQSKLVQPFKDRWWRRRKM